MSKYNKNGIKSKHNFRRNLERFAQEQIDEFVNPKKIDLEIEAFESELSLYDDYDPRDDYDDYDYDYDYDYDNYDDYDPYDDDYDYDYSPGIYEDDFTFSYYCNAGTYYKDKNGKTYLCAEIDGRNVFVNVHTGRQEFPVKLQKVG